MYILTRYVVWEVSKFFLAALAALTLVFTLVMGIKQGLSMGLTPPVMLRTMPFVLTETLGITIPVSMLFAVSSVFGRMTGANEIVAIKSLGINPMAVVWPVLVFACFLSLGTVWMYEIAATWCRPNFARISSKSYEEIAYGMLRLNQSCTWPPRDPSFSIVVRRVDGRTLIQPTIIIFAQAGRQQIVIRAETAELSTDAQEQQLNIVASNGEFKSGSNSISFSDTRTWSLAIRPPPLDRYHRDLVAMRDIPELIAELEARRQSLEQLRQARKALGDPDLPEDASRIESCRRQIYRLRAETYRRWSNGFTCLCFALIGTPVAMLWRHADVLTNFFLCFLPILSLYYPLLMLSEDLATSGKPPILFCMGNVLLLGLAVLLFRRIVRH